MTSSLDPRLVNNLYLKLSKHIPEPRTELLYNSDFELLISVILSAQATVKNSTNQPPILPDPPMTSALLPLP